MKYAVVVTIAPTRSSCALTVSRRPRASWGAGGGIVGAWPDSARTHSGIGTRGVLRRTESEFIGPVYKDQGTMADGGRGTVRFSLQVRIPAVNWQRPDFQIQGGSDTVS